MMLIRLGANTVDNKKRNFECVATIGNFDGVHRGHQFMIKKLLDLSRQYQLPSVVVTFEPSPKTFFLKEFAPLKLTSFREKYQLLQALMIDYLCVLRFNAAMATLSATDFIRFILVEKLRVKHLIVGEDFRFGKDRLGDLDLLKCESKKFGLDITVVPLVLVDGQKVSSTGIREALLHHRFNEAATYLGRSPSRKVKYNERTV